MTNPKNATTTSRGRSYKWGTEEFTSVTTILSNGIPKPALTNWASKMAATYAVENREAWAELENDAAIDLIKGAPWRDRDKAASLGSNLHDYAEAEALGKPMPEADLILAPYVDQVRKFVKDFEVEFLMSEATVYSRKHQYAGTLDGIVVINGKTYLMDWKTSRSGIFAETALQLNAYAFADFIGLPDGSEESLPEFDGALGVHIVPAGYTVIPIEVREETFRSFLYAAEVAKFVRETGPTLLGAPMAPPLKVVA